MRRCTLSTKCNSLCHWGRNLFKIQLNQGNQPDRHLNQFSSPANSALFNAAQTTPNNQMVLMDDTNAGYERLAELQVKKVNGIKIENLAQLCRVVGECKEESVRFDLDDDRVIVLNYDRAKVATFQILKCHRISSAMSLDLVSQQDVPR
ncbi:hypothetical protein POM88_045148 [Heracleum sosnowskyi]|uniref:Protease Do-like PDZ domain-containing protein n=1 Tax=Heracleum sosnowskyi TaxID=360622 RepID=A0AAD8H6R0_9APIA|nr:hypothetical protein POM88_045148 [Heracleum sosnowskyi]